MKHVFRHGPCCKPHDHELVLEIAVEIADIGNRVSPVERFVPQLVEIDKAFLVCGENVREINLEQMNETDYWQLYEEVNARGDLKEEVDNE